MALRAALCAARPGAPDWAREGRDWPQRESSRFVEAGGIRWHVQRAGAGPVLLLVHGTGAATHSWRGLAPLLAPHFDVIAPDLPGHGFSAAPPSGNQSLPAMARALGGLLETLDACPAICVGHSAGAAILARMAQDRRVSPAALVSLNGALLPMRGLQWAFFSPLARVLAASGLAARLFARRATDPRAVARMLEGTGSRLDARGTELYARLLRTPGHVAAALGMMAQWDLRGLARDLPALECALVLVVGTADRTVPPGEAERVRARVASARVVRLAGLGHLAHEEAPQRVADAIVGLARDVRAGRR